MKETVPELDQRCDGSHRHLQLRGKNFIGKFTSQAAVYPKKFREAIVRLAKGVVPRSGGESHPSAFASQISKIAKTDAFQIFSTSAR